jgi:hypothetical protein
MKDKVFAVREQVINSLLRIINILDKTWLEANIERLIEPFLEEQDYTIRLNYFLCIQVRSFLT